MRILSVVVVAAASPAFAEELAADRAQVEPTHSPGFVTTLRQDGVSRAGADLTYLSLEESGNTTLLRLDLHGHYVEPASGIGGYAQIPLLLVNGPDDSETVLGGVELGMIYIPKLATPGFAVVLRGGVTLPTVEDDTFAFAGLVATYLRPTDLYAQIPRSSTLRLAASPMFRSGPMFVRLDVGADINVYNDGGDTVDPGVLLNVGVGLDLGTMAVMTELTTIAVTGDSQDAISAAAISTRFRAWVVQPYAALLFPVDDDAGDAFDGGLLVGLEGPM